MNKAAVTCASLVALLASPAGHCAASWYLATATGNTAIVVSDEQAASGNQSLKFADGPSASRPGQPHLYVKPTFLTKGTGLFACDILLGEDAVAGIQFRTQTSAARFPVGPTLTFRAGKVMASGRRGAALSYAPGAWLSVRVVLHLDGSARYDLEVGPKGGAMHRFRDLPCQSPQFKQCGVIVIMSPGTKESAFHIDNLVVRALD